MTVPNLQWHTRAKPVLGTLVEVSFLWSGDEDAESMARSAFAKLSIYQRAMSFHEPGSDVLALSTSKPGGRIRVAPETWSVLAAALAFETESRGLFNVAIAPELVARRLLPAPPAKVDSQPLSASAFAALRMEEGEYVTVLQPVWIDLGGIAKGAAVDAALSALRAAGASAAVVNAGGDLACYGPVDRPIEVVGPNRVRVSAGSLGDGALATSGPFGAEGRHDFVLPPGTAACWADRTVTVVAPTCLVADAMTKIVAALGADASPMLARHRAQGFSIDGKGRLEKVGANA